MESCQICKIVVSQSVGGGEHVVACLFASDKHRLFTILHDVASRVASRRSYHTAPSHQQRPQNILRLHQDNTGTGLITSKHQKRIWKFSLNYLDIFFQKKLESKYDFFPLSFQNVI